VGAKLYFDFTDPQDFEEVYEKLKREIGDSGKSVSTVSIFYQLLS